MSSLMWWLLGRMIWYLLSCGIFACFKRPPTRNVPRSSINGLSSFILLFVIGFFSFRELSSAWKMDCWMWLITAILAFFTSSAVRNSFSFFESSLQLLRNLLVYARRLHSSFHYSNLTNSSCPVATKATKKSLVFISSLISGSISKWKLPWLSWSFQRSCRPLNHSWPIFVSPNSSPTDFTSLVQMSVSMWCHDISFEPKRFISNVLKHWHWIGPECDGSYA